MNHLLNLSRHTALRFFLVFSALGWGVCIAGIFAPGNMVFDLLSYVGGIDPAPLQQDVMYDYWLRMASSVFTLIGMGYLILAIMPRRFAMILPFAGMFMLVEGVILLVHGIRLGLPLTPFSGDVAFCLIGGIGILACMGSVRNDMPPRDVT